MSGIVITGITGFKNRGVDALVTTVIEGIRKVSKSSTNITVLTDTPDYDKISGKLLEVTFVSDAIRNRRARYLRKLVVNPLANLLIPYLTPHYKKTVNVLQKADVVVASGGDVFSSDYGDLGEFLVSLELAKQAGKKVVFLGHSIGPFKTKKEEEAWSRLAMKSDLITLRESYSYDYVVNKLRIPKSKVFLTADSAFNLSLPDEKKLEQLARIYNIDRTMPTIALSISQGIKKFAKVHSERHIQAWAELVRTAVEELGLQVLIVPHVQDTWELNDDRLASNEVASLFGGNDKIKVIDGDHSASELKGLIEMAEVVIAERMHAAIAGLSTGTATAVIGYSIKAQGILHDLLGARVKEYELLVPVQDFVDKIEMKEWLSQLWSTRKEISNALHHELPRIKRQALKNFEILAKILS